MDPNRITVRHYQDFFTNPVMQLFQHRLEMVKQSEMSTLRKALESSSEKAHKANGVIEGIEKAQLLLNEVKKELEKRLK